MIRVNRITPVKIEQYIAVRQSRNMNITTLRKLIVTLNQIMKYAVRHNYIAMNPVAIAERLKKGQEIDPTKDSHTIKILTPAEINKLLDAEEDQKFRTLLQLAISSGGPGRVNYSALSGPMWIGLTIKSESGVPLTRTHGTSPNPKHPSETLI